MTLSSSWALTWALMARAATSSIKNLTWQHHAFTFSLSRVFFLTRCPCCGLLFRFLFDMISYKTDRLKGRISRSDRLSMKVDGGKSPLRTPDNPPPQKIQGHESTILTPIGIACLTRRRVAAAAATKAMSQRVATTCSDLTC